MTNFSKLYSGLGGYTCQLYDDARQHGGGYVFASEEERLEKCTIGEQQMRAIVDACDIVELKNALGDYQDYVQRMYQKFPRIKKVR